MPGFNLTRLGLDDLARGFHAHHLRQRVRDPGTVVAHVEIDAIERRRGDLEHGTSPGQGPDREVPPADAVGAAPFQNCRLHCALSVGQRMFGHTFIIFAPT